MFKNRDNWAEERGEQSGIWAGKLMFGSVLTKERGKLKVVDVYILHGRHIEIAVQRRSKAQKQRIQWDGIYRLKDDGFQERKVGKIEAIFSKFPGQPKNYDQKIRSAKREHGRRKTIILSFISLKGSCPLQFPGPRRRVDTRTKRGLHFIQATEVSPSESTLEHSSMESRCSPNPRILFMSTNSKRCQNRLFYICYTYLVKINLNACDIE